MTKVSLTLIDKAAQRNIPIREIATGERYRKSFNGIEELAKSIEEKGLLNPICIQALPEADSAGCDRSDRLSEQRWIGADHGKRDEQS